MEDDLKKWKITLKIEDDLKNGRWPPKWKTTSKMENDPENGRWPQKWKMTSKTEEDLKKEDDPVDILNNFCFDK